VVCASESIVLGSASEWGISPSPDGVGLFKSVGHESGSALPRSPQTGAAEKRKLDPVVGDDQTLELVPDARLLG
jgi:hypothetical protein